MATLISTPEADHLRKRIKSLEYWRGSHSNHLNPCVIVTDRDSYGYYTPNTYRPVLSFWLYFFLSVVGTGLALIFGWLPAMIVAGLFIAGPFYKLGRRVWTLLRLRSLHNQLQALRDSGEVFEVDANLIEAWRTTLLAALNDMSAEQPDAPKGSEPDWYKDLIAELTHYPLPEFPAEAAPREHADLFRKLMLLSKMRGERRQLLATPEAKEAGLSVNGDEVLTDIDNTRQRLLEEAAAGVVPRIIDRCTNTHASKTFLQMTEIDRNAVEVQSILRGM
jgi:hypothetical protein